VKASLQGLDDKTLPRQLHCQRAAAAPPTTAPRAPVILRRMSSLAAVAALAAVVAEPREDSATASVLVQRVEWASKPLDADADDVAVAAVEQRRQRPGALPAHAGLVAIAMPDADASVAVVVSVAVVASKAMPRHYPAGKLSRNREAQHQRERQASRQTQRPQCDRRGRPGRRDLGYLT